jgi:quercetin dioxygenase-like cupin family protein
MAGRHARETRISHIVVTADGAGTRTLDAAANTSPVLQRPVPVEPETTMHTEKQPDHLWFMNNVARVRVAQADNADRLSVIELAMPYDEAPPLHIHHSEDEIFHLLDGEMRFEVDGAIRHARSGETVLAPRGSRHSFRVVSSKGVRVLIITRGGFEGMVRAVARPAGQDAMPPLSAPTEEQRERLTAECAMRDIEIVGPPIA